MRLVSHACFAIGFSFLLSASSATADVEIIGPSSSYETRNGNGTVVAITFCMGGGCGGDPAYRGPMLGTAYGGSGGGAGSSLSTGSGSSSGGNYSPGPDMLPGPRMPPGEATYRAANAQAAQAFRAEIEQRLTAAARSRQQTQQDAVGLERTRTEVLAALNRIAPEQGEIASLEQRRQENPLPPGQDEAGAQAPLNPVWSAVNRGDPAAVANEVAQIYRRCAAPGANGAECRFQKRELVYSRIADDRGFVNLPFVPTPDLSVNFETGSPLAASGREAVNAMLANRSLVGSICEGVQGDVEKCAAALDAIDGEIEGLGITGQLSAIGAVAMPYAREAVAAIERNAQRIVWISEGMHRGLIRLSDGLEQIAEHPTETIGALASMMMNQVPYAWGMMRLGVPVSAAITTALLAPVALAIGQSVAAKVAEFRDAKDEATRYRIAGEVLFEATVIVAPQAALAQAGRLVVGAAEMAAAAQAARLVAGPIGMAASVAAMRVADGVPGAVGSGLNREMGGVLAARILTRRFPEFAAQSESLAAWSRTYLNVGDQAVLPITFARVMTPSRWGELQGALKGIESTTSLEARQFVVNQVTHESWILQVGKYSETDMIRLANQYDHFAQRMASAAAAPASAEGYWMTRVSPPTFRVPQARGAVGREVGFEVPMNSERLWGESAFSDFRNHRFSEPDKTALYGSLGSDGAAADLARAEGGIAAGSPEFLETRLVRPERVLDLRDPAELWNRFGLRPTDLTRESGAGAYEITQTLGELARRQGFDAILAPSAKGEGANIILFPRSR